MLSKPLEGMAVGRGLGWAASHKNPDAPDLAAPLRAARCLLVCMMVGTFFSHKGLYSGCTLILVLLLEEVGSTQEQQRTEENQALC